MQLSLNYGALVAFLLVMARALGWLMFVPPFNDRRIVAPYATMGIAAGLAVLIGPSLPRASLPSDTAGLIAAIVLQVTTGVAIGFIVNLLLSAITSAGSLVDLAGGLNLPSAIDPLSLDQVPMLGQFYQQIALLLLFVSGGYEIMIEGFARSFQAPGFTLASTQRIAITAVTDFTTFFTSALEIAGPILVVLFSTQIVLALLSKAAPQMNVWILGMPMQVFLGIALVAIGISVIPSYLGNLLSRAMADTAHMFGPG